MNSILSTLSNSYGAMAMVLATGICFANPAKAKTPERSNNPKDQKSEILKSEVLGVWELTKFVTVDTKGDETPWCSGAQGTIAYLPNYMTVVVQCESYAPDSAAAELEGRLFYSGTFEFDTQEQQVIHHVRNASHSSLYKSFVRTAEKDNPNHLRLVGELGAGEKVIVEWSRTESFTYSSEQITGVWELAISDNEVPGEDRTVPFCSGFKGTILYTPGGFVSVSINCGEKIDNEVPEPADLFGRQYFYTGSYEMDQAVGVMRHMTRFASVPDHAGQTYQRGLELTNDKLFLNGENGSRFRSMWSKIGSFQEL